MESFLVKAKCVPGIGIGLGALIDWLIARLFDWLFNWSIDWLIDRLSHGLIDPLIDRFIDWFIYQAIDWIIPSSLLRLVSRVYESTRRIIFFNRRHSSARKTRTTAAQNRRTGRSVIEISFRGEMPRLQPSIHWSLQDVPYGKVRCQRSLLVIRFVRLRDGGQIGAGSTEGLRELWVSPEMRVGCLLTGTFPEGRVGIGFRGFVGANSGLLVEFFAPISGGRRAVCSEEWRENFAGGWHGSRENHSSKYFVLTMSWRVIDHSMFTFISYR